MASPSKSTGLPKVPIIDPVAEAELFEKCPNLNDLLDENNLAVVGINFLLGCREKLQNSKKSLDEANSKVQELELQREADRQKIQELENTQTCPEEGDDDESQDSFMVNLKFALGMGEQEGGVGENLREFILDKVLTLTVEAAEAKKEVDKLRQVYGQAGMRNLKRVSGANGHLLKDIIQAFAKNNGGENDKTDIKVEGQGLDERCTQQPSSSGPMPNTSFNSSPNKTQLTVDDLLHIPRLKKRPAVEIKCALCENVYQRLGFYQNHMLVVHGVDKTFTVAPLVAGGKQMRMDMMDSQECSPSPQQTCTESQQDSGDESD